MLCKYPYVLQRGRWRVPVGCGQCIPCRINRRRVWTLRLVLESLCHDDSCFVTLTYDDDALAAVGQSLDPAELQTFMKRLRNYYPPRSVKFFGVGEYGSKFGRPHYHLLLYGVSAFDQRVIEKCWTNKQRASKGFVSCYELNVQTAQYVCKYVMKGQDKWTHPSNMCRHPEFMRSSNGLGKQAALTLVSSVRSEAKNSGTDAEVLLEKLSGTVRIAGQKLPLGRYMIGQLRQIAGMSDEEVSRKIVQFFEEKTAEVSELLPENGLSETPYSSVSELVAAQSSQRRASIEALWKIKQSEDKL